MNKRLKFTFFLIFCLFAVVFFILSCKKEISDYAKPDVSVSEKFFAHSLKTDKIILRVIDEIKNRNNKNQFVADFAILNGFPVWDKPIISYPSAKASTVSSFVNANIEEPIADTFAYIPIVPENSDKVNGFILAKISNGVELLYSLAKDYKAFSFEGGGGLNDATKFVLTNLLLNKEVFGISDYKITDYKLFTDNPEHDKVNEVSIEGRLSAGECAIISWQSQYCGTPRNSKCLNGCDNCGVYCYPTTSSVEICTAPNTVNWPAGGIGINTGGGGSGGGGGQIPHYYPCIPQPVHLLGDAPPPCPEPGPGSGWIPLDEDPLNEQPFDSIPDIISRVCTIQMDSLYQWGMTNGFREQSFIVVKKDGFIYPKNYKPGFTSGDKTKVNYSLSSGEILIAYIHIHAEDTTQFWRTSFSGEDLKEFNKYANFVGYTAIVEVGNARYAFVLENLQNKNNFNIIKRGNHVKNYENILDSISNQYPDGQIRTEQAWIIYLGSASISGIGYFKSTYPFKNNFIKLNP